MSDDSDDRTRLDLLVPDCMLSAPDLQARGDDFRAVVSASVRTATRPEPTRLRLDLDPDPAIASQVARLVTAETQCCSFFTFTLTARSGSLTLDVQVPPDRVPVLEALAGSRGSA